jgi:hypothetical protein
MAAHNRKGYHTYPYEGTLKGEGKSHGLWFVIKLVARGIIEGLKRPFFFHLAEP